MTILEEQELIELRLSKQRKKEVQNESYKYFIRDPGSTFEVQHRKRKYIPQSEYENDSF